MLLMQLKTDILSKATCSVSVAISSNESINLGESYDPLLPDFPLPTDTTNMLDILLNSIGGNLSTVNDATPDDQDDTATAKMLCENELYQLLLGNDFKMKMQNTETKAFNCLLSWWKSSAHRFKNFERFAVMYLVIPATSTPSECIWSQAARVLTVRQNKMSEEVTSALCIAKKIGSFCTSTIWRLQRRGCIMTTITLLKNTRLFCLHLKMKGMLIQKSMLLWMWTKRKKRKNGPSICTTNTNMQIHK
jgi:hypothetical protein